MNPTKEEENQSKTATKVSAGNFFLRQFLSPAMGLAILGTFALIFSFYRAGQLSNLVISKDEIRQAEVNASSFKHLPKIDINSQAVVDAADHSEANMFVIAGDYKQATVQAFKDLTNYPPDYLPSIVEAGDILSQFGNDKELGFGLLERAVAMAPNNQYIALRYTQRLMTSSRNSEAEPKLLQLAHKYPQWPDPRIVLSKFHYLQDKKALATTELISLDSGKNLNSRQAEQISLMLAKLGRVADGFTLFQQAASSEPAKCFYANYCQDWLTQNPDSYETVLAMVKSNLASTANYSNVAKRLNLEIKHGALLLLLGRPQDAQSALQQAITAHSNNFDLYVLLAAAYVIQGQTEQAKTTFQTAAQYYQLKL